MSRKDAEHLSVLQGSTTPQSPNHPSRKPLKTGQRPQPNSDSTQDNKPSGFPAPATKPTRRNPNEA